MSWLYYLLEANMYLAIFYGFYWLLLRRETFYELNRAYLLITSALSFLLPVLQIGYLNSLLNPVLYEVPISIPYSAELLSTTTATPTLTTEDIVFFGYLLVAGFLLLRLGNSFYRIIKIAANADKTRNGNVIQVHFKQSDTAFSFFNLLFINPETDRQGVVLQHEMIHIKQKHSLDVLFFEVLLICNWFNPLCWLIKKDIKLIHEYIADEETINQGLAKHDYAMFLIHNSFGPPSNPLTSQMFNQSILKNRINMLNKTKSTGRTRLRLLYVLPIMGGMLCASTLAFTKDYGVIDLYSERKAPLPSALFKEFEGTTKQEPKQEKKKRFPIESKYNAETGQNHPVKLVVINGKISPAKNFDSVYDYDQVKELNSTEATAKYGKRAAKGALEFTGKRTHIAIQFPPPIPDKNETVPPTPPKPPLEPKQQKIKFPPPIVKPMEKIEDHPEVKATKSQEILEVGKTPLFINNGSIVIVNPGEGKTVSYTAKSAKVTPKNNAAAIAKYGESARDGVIELEDGEFFTTEANSKKTAPIKKD